MTSIKPPGGPGGVPAPGTTESTQGPARPAGPSFQDRVAEKRGPSAATGPAQNPSQAVVADLRAGRIGPDDAVRQLADLAVQRSGAPPAMRPVIEAQLRELLARDPLVQDLLRQMGASVPSDK